MIMMAQIGHYWLYGAAQSLPRLSWLCQSSRGWDGDAPLQPGNGLLGYHYLICYGDASTVKPPPRFELKWCWLAHDITQAMGQDPGKHSNRTSACVVGDGDWIGKGS